MAITFRLEIKKQPTSQGTYPIFIRITKDRKLKRIRTSVELKRLSDWNPRTKNQTYIRASEPNATKWNADLLLELEKARDIYRDDASQSVDAIASKFKGNTTSFIEYAKAHTEWLEASGSSNAKHYKSFCQKLQDFTSSTKRTDITFSDITPALLSEFEGYLRGCTNNNTNDDSIRLNPNYIRAIMIKFRAVVNKAIKEGLMKLEKYPFKKYSLPKEVAVDRQALDEAEIQSIIDLDLPEGGRLWDTRNCFLFSFYCAGIRVGDLLQLRWNNITDEGTRIQYVMEKNQKQRNYSLIPQAQQILSYYWNEDAKPTDYIFPFLDSKAKYAKYADANTMPLELKRELYAQVSAKNALLNKELRKIAELAEISKHLSFHCSRHSFASIARGKDVSSKIVQEALAHSSLTITERYMHTFSSSEMDKALQKVYGTDASQSKEEAILKALKGLDKEALANILAQLK